MQSTQGMCGGKRRSRRSLRSRRGKKGGAYSSIGPAIGSSGMAQNVPVDTSSALAGRGGNNNVPDITPDTANASGFPDVPSPAAYGGKKSRRRRMGKSRKGAKKSRKVHRGGMSPVVWSANTVAGPAPAQSVPRTGYIFNGSGTNGIVDAVPY